MRVLLVSGIFPPDIGGPATYTARVAECFHRRGHFVQVLTYTPASGRSGRSACFPVVRMPRVRAKPARFVTAVAAIRRLAEQSDVVLASSLLMEAACARCLNRTPLVAKIVADWAWERATARGRSTDPFGAFQARRQPIDVELMKHARAWAARRADAVITPSGHMREAVVRWGVPAGRTFVVYNAAEEARVGEPPAALPAFGGKTLITVGRLLPVKGIDRLIVAVASMPNVRLVIVGSGPQGEDLGEVARALDVRDRVLFVGQVSTDQVDAYLRQSDVFVLNSTHEGTPHAVLEAMRAGLPVVATAVGGVPEIIENGETGLLIPPGDDTALRMAIERVITDGFLAARLGRSGQSWAAAHFNWDVLLDRTEHILERTAGLCRA